ncbi:LPS ABC transporter substrate-binding protein LptA [Megasphaera vaginalis (ex Srinivasan et al. 2021)]|uniref:Putative lipopolysaccharide transport periplasmic protein LptA n=1 Tax=Megasphaera vaginalis (ex Srinivasan et al. 2021) TaxID=1111454 RepID=U7UMH3_9FIRM|nr:LPS ABC transporter substrate-binding protein LptA [Megasphaera vaginalis (ex Srinivasan et al. 2021)]ERT60506.1 putative lipopolysaccharide transport periplasmic protein LptA [Megasphaera vaginalis (ex Srinivasan et al. 2021)]
MKRKLRDIYKAVTAAAFLTVPLVAAWAAGPSISVTADRLSYDGKTQVATASGNVVIVRDQTTMTGDTAVYHLKTAEADVEGNVAVEQPDMHLTANKLHSTNRNYVVATGDVKGVYQDKKVNGDQVEYYLDQDRSVVTGNGYLEAQGSQMWADHIDGWFKSIKAVGTGNVHIESPQERLSAYSDQATYTQTPGVNDGVIYLQGNVQASQNGSSLVGDKVQIRLADHSAQTMSRSTIVIVPNES